MDRRINREAGATWLCRNVQRDLSRFFPRFDRILFGEALNPFFKQAKYRIFGISFYTTTFSFSTLNKFTLSFKSPIFKNMEVPANPKTQTL